LDDLESEDIEEIKLEAIDLKNPATATFAKHFFSISSWLDATSCSSFVPYSF